jgi:class 3 adenylate cyclase
MLRAQEIDLAGDSLFLIFAVPSDAAEFGLILQSKLRTLFQGTGIAVQDRISIKLREVLIREPVAEHQRRDLFGLQVDTCSRVMGLAKGGQLFLLQGRIDRAVP